VGAEEVLRGELTTAQLATKYGVHQTMVSDWKRQAMDGLSSLFTGKTEAKDAVREGEIEKLMRRSANWWWNGIF
jgi:transposase